MGLDIRAYRNVKKIRQLRKGEDYENYQNKEVEFFCSYWPEKMLPLEENFLYSYDEYHSFRAGSYGGYNFWRRTLAYFQNTLVEEVWNKDLKIPFSELINFSDCEGTIAGQTAVKLYHDFITYEEKYTEWVKQEKLDDWVIKNYKDFKQAFKLASENGAVKFS